MYPLGVVHKSQIAVEIQNHVCPFSITDIIQEATNEKRNLNRYSTKHTINLLLAARESSNFALASLC